MGLALCGLYVFTRHPTAVRKNFDSRTFDLFRIKCFLWASSCPERLVCNFLIGEDNELVSLRQRTFIWVLFIPYTAHSHYWSQYPWANFSFDSSALDFYVESSGINLVYRHNMEELTRWRLLGSPAEINETHVLELPGPWEPTCSGCTLTLSVGKSSQNFVSNGNKTILRRDEVDSE